jgi:cellobiose phosphorylase
VPRAWGEYTIEYRFGASVYVITVRRDDALPPEASRVAVDGGEVEDGAIVLVDDGARHEVTVLM